MFQIDKLQGSKLVETEELRDWVQDVRTKFNLVDLSFQLTRVGAIHLVSL